MERRQVILVAFYNKKALGVRYLETALNGAGYNVTTIFYKDFNSVHPRPATEREIELFLQVVREKRPVFVGLSVMSSMYLDTVYQLMDGMRQERLAPLVCGEAYATMFPQKLLERGADFVVRSDGERAICRLADTLRLGCDWRTIPSLCWWEAGEFHQNDIGDLHNDVDGYGIPTVNSVGACFIDHDTITWGDPQRNTRSYEVIASRGCPFTCSYCCCVNLRRLLPKEIPGVRTRSVNSVINELIEARRHCKKIVFVHFYDEIFPNLPGWVDEFAKKYEKHIHIPFTIWSHPKMVDLDMLKKLRRVGLTEVIMGIQSGSERVRRDIFHRYETQEDILRAVSAIQDAGVFWGSFDLMLQHPFETIEDLKESYYLVQKFPGRFELQLHGLNFLPGTDIVNMAIQQGYYTPAELERIMYAPMEEQFGAYWKREVSQESQLWYEMIYCWQFFCFRSRLRRWENAPKEHIMEIHRAYQQAERLARFRYIWKKGNVVFRRMAMECSSIVHRT